MQKRFITRLLTLLFVLSFSAAPSIANGPNPGSDPSLNTCPAPAPTGLNVVSVTPTTITLAWFSGVGIFYKIDVFDVTGGFPLPPIFTPVSPSTITGLTPGHTYQITVSASYCANGPFGPPSAALMVTTPGIIIDMIVYLDSPCTLPDGRTVGAGNAPQICVSGTYQTALHEFADGVIGRVVYQTREVHFGMAWIASSQEFHIGILGNQGFNTSSGFEFFVPKDANGDPIIPSPYTICRYNGADIFRVDMELQTTNPNIAHATLTFQQTCTFSYCGEDCGVGSRPADKATETEWYEPTEADERGASETLLDVPAPNPFSESATIRYSLAEPAMVEIGLYDAIGNLVETVQTAELLPEGEHTATVSGTALANGVYFLRVRTGSEYKSFALVKQE